MLIFNTKSSMKVIRNETQLSKQEVKNVSHCHVTCNYRIDNITMRYPTGGTVMKTNVLQVNNALTFNDNVLNV